MLVLSGSAWADAAAKVNPAVKEGELNSIDMQLFRQFSVMEYTPGQPLEVTITMSASMVEGLTAIGLYETLPPEWVFGGLRGLTGDPPTVSPQPGDMGVLEFAWIQIPILPYTFAYIITPPETGGGPVYISGQIEYRTHGGAQKSPPVISNLNGQDRIAPAITVLGANPLQVTQNTAFADPGATANDNVDGDISSRIQTIGNVDTSTLGTYTITYRVSDQAGNQAEATRTVLVVTAAATTGTGGVYAGGGTSSRGRASGTSRSSTGASSAAASKQNTQKPANVNVNVTPDTTANARLAEMMAKREETQNKLKEAQKHVATHAKNEGGKPPAKAAPGTPGAPSASEGQSEETPDAALSTSPEGQPAMEEAAKPAAEDNTAPVASKPPKVSATPPSPGVFAVLKERFAQMTPSQLAGLMVGFAIALALLAFTLLAWKVAYSPPVRRRPNNEKTVEEEK